MNKVEEIKNTNKQQRVSAHSHIKGLGLGEDGNVATDSCGLIGQNDARRVRNFRCLLCYVNRLNIVFYRLPVSLSS